jgi:hypothetical protein
VLLAAAVDAATCCAANDGAVTVEASPRTAATAVSTMVLKRFNV